jgi:preprotein translocase subunit SecA
MFDQLLKSIFGSKHDKDVREAQPLVEEINGFAAEYQAISDQDLAGKTAEFRARLAAGETLDDLLPEAYAAVKEPAAACADAPGRWPGSTCAGTWCRTTSS